MAAWPEPFAEVKESSHREYATNVPYELKEAHDLTMEQGQPIEPVIIGEKTVKQMRTIKNCPTVEVCDYRNVVLDPTCNGDISKAKFLVYSCESSLAELTKDYKYKNLDRIYV